MELCNIFGLSFQNMLPYTIKAKAVFFAQIFLPSAPASLQHSKKSLDGIALTYLRILVSLEKKHVIATILHQERNETF